MKRPLRYWYLRLVRQSGTPEQIAGGVAIGVLVGLACPPGVQMLIALAAASLLKCNRVLAVALVWITNPFTMPFIYSAQLAVGCFITGTPISDTVVRALPDNSEEFWDFVLDVRTHLRSAIILFTGAVTTGITAAGVSFYVAKFAVIEYRKVRNEKRLLKVAERARHRLDSLLYPHHHRKPEEIAPEVPRRESPD